MRRILNIIIAAVVIATSTNCKDDIENENPSEANDEEKDKEDEMRFVDSISSQSIISQLFDTQSDVYSLKYGSNFNQSEPNTYYYACSDSKEAALFYNNYCTKEPQQVKFEMEGDSMTTSIEVGDKKSTFGDYGYTSLSIGKGAPDYATIEISFDSIGDIFKLVFVPQSYIPENSDAQIFQSPYTMGYIYEDEKGEQWLCVESSSPSRNGYLVRIETESSKSYYSIESTADDHWKGSVTHAKAKSGTTIAYKEAWEAFISMSNYGQGTRVMDAMKNHTKGVKMDETYKVMQTIIGDNEDWLFFQGGNVWSTSTKFCSKCWFYVYWISFPYIVVHGKHGYIINNIWTKHEISDNNWGKARNSGYNPSRVLLQITFKDEKTALKNIFPGRQSSRN